MEQNLFGELQERKQHLVSIAKKATEYGWITLERQKEIIDNLKTQNTTLKEQVAGISALGNAVKEASTVINNHHEDSEKEADEYDSDLEYGYLDGALDETFQKTKIA